jgi:uncharacterized protein with HEPN domain
MRPERLYLQDILDAADNISFHIAGRSAEHFLGDRTVRAAVLHELTVIGEAAARLSQDFRERHSEVPWMKIVAFRNLVVHEYFGLDWPIVWNTATTLVPQLRHQVAAVARGRVSRVGQTGFEKPVAWGPVDWQNQRLVGTEPESSRPDLEIDSPVVRSGSPAGLSEAPSVLRGVLQSAPRISP